MASAHGTTGLKVRRRSPFYEYQLGGALTELLCVNNPTPTWSDWSITMRNVTNSQPRNNSYLQLSQMLKAKRNTKCQRKSNISPVYASTWFWWLAAHALTSRWWSLRADLGSCSNCGACGNVCKPDSYCSFGMCGMARRLMLFEDVCDLLWHQGISIHHLLGSQKRETVEHLLPTQPHLRAGYSGFLTAGMAGEGMSRKEGSVLDQHAYLTWVFLPRNASLSSQCAWFPSTWLVWVKSEQYGISSQMHLSAAQAFTVKTKAAFCSAY